jgi:pimeloyl-ACP methyl ester carboxylesterase
MRKNKVRSTMSLFCLVHGSTQSPEGWKLLVSALNARGHDCICVDLPIDEPNAGATRYAGIIAEALPSGSKPIVVAHSASGLFLPFVPDQAPVARLVYLAAVIPLPGQSFLSQFNENPEMYRPDFVGEDPTKDPALARHYLFHDCPPGVVPWALSTLRLMFAKQAIMEASPLEEWPQVSCSYISCTEDRAINPEWWEAAALARLATQPIRMKAGHAPHVSRPEELAELLDSLAS